MIAQYVPVAMAAILIAAMVLEVRTGRLPNWLTLTPFALFAVVLFSAGDIWALMPQVYLGVGVFVAGLLLFAIAGIGAGAVKLMSGVALFVPVSEAFYTLMVFMTAFFVSAFVIVQLRKYAGSEQSKWYVMAHAVLPMSIPIGIAGLVSLFSL
ncbi:prepilin peptidase [Loktanella sp. Alg231-35]|uniref:prepilin peptidase n=1 Tax=Loktanella sp. Alg231-35 TaxID=1922220 RepID=UPI001F166C77|nr:prepilin peptidase [Loktanella sp. Alg231-35]